VIGMIIVLAGGSKRTQDADIAKAIEIAKQE
jgi:putative component of toxin-antitoxin plasmid stabilization module